MPLPRDLPKTLLVLWAAVFVYAFRSRDRTLQLMAFWIVIVPFPLAFIRPIRGVACVYDALTGELSPLWFVLYTVIRT
jgi:hypothetical protein